MRPAPDVTAPSSPGRRGPHRRRRAGAESALAAVLGMVGMAGALLQLFWGQDIGLADNGDGFRLMCHFDLLKSVDVIGSPLVFHYDFTGHGCLPNLAYLSSQEWLVRPAVWAYRLQHGAEAGFDLRYLGVLHSAVFGALLAGLYLTLPGSRRVRLLATVLAGVLLADVTFVTYFVSPFSEPAAFLGLVAVVAATAWYVREGSRPLLALGALLAATVLLVLAKAQMFVFALLLSPVLVSRTVEAGPLRGPWKGRLAPAAACLVLVVTAGVNVVRQPDFFAEVNKHNLVFHTLLVDSSDPEATLRSLGAPTGLVRYRGTGYFAVEAAAKEQDPEYQQFQQVVDRGKIAAYLATNPDHWPEMLRAGAQAVSTLRTAYLSNYPVPRPGDELLAERPNPTERLLGALGTASWPVLPLVWLVALVAGAVALLRRSGSPQGRALAAVCYVLGGTALSQVLVALIGDGYYELVKHTVLAGYATALLLAITVASLVPAVSRRLPRRTSDRTAPAG